MGSHLCLKLSTLDRRGGHGYVLERAVQASDGETLRKCAKVPVEQQQSLEAVSDGKVYELDSAEGRVGRLTTWRVTSRPSGLW